MLGCSRCRGFFDVVLLKEGGASPIRISADFCLLLLARALGETGRCMNSAEPALQHDAIRSAVVALGCPLFLKGGCVGRPACWIQDRGVSRC